MSPGNGFVDNQNSTSFFNVCTDIWLALSNKSENKKEMPPTLRYIDCTHKVGNELFQQKRPHLCKVLFKPDM